MSRLATLGTDVTNVTHPMKTQSWSYLKKATARRAEKKTVLLVGAQQQGFYGGAPGGGLPYGLPKKYQNIVQRLKGGGKIRLPKGVQVLDLHGAPNWISVQVLDVDVAPGRIMSMHPALVTKTFREVLSLAYGVVEDVASGRQISKSDLLMKVSDAFAAEAKTEQSTKSTEEAWQGLLVKGLERKKALLNSPQFKSVAEVAELLDVKEPAIRRRIRECKLIALKSPGTDEYRIPVWALAISPVETKEIQTAGGEMDAWSLHHFMSTPNSWLNGLRPFELLLAPGSLTSEQLARRLEVAEHFGVSDANSLLDVVLKALAHEVTEESEV